MELFELTAHELHAKLDRKETSAEEIVKSVLGRISTVENSVSAFMTINIGEAITKAKEIDDAASLIAEIDARIPLVLQPVTPHGMIKHRPSLEQLFSFHAIARRKLEKVRIIPQMHRQLGLA